MTSDTQRLRGRHVLVTGAGTGIGRAIALRLAAEGASLSLVARDGGRLERTADEIAEHGAQRPFVAAADVRERSAVRDAFARAHEAHGGLHAVVANSGIGGPNEPGDDDRFDDLVATNLAGTYHCLRAGEEHLADGPEIRHLVAVSSILARIGVPGYTGYCASKAGILGLVRALAAELAPQHVQVNALCPGWVNTAMAREGIVGIARATGISEAEAEAEALSSVPAGRMSEPEEIAGVAAWLIGDDARGVTGQGIDVNGGAFMI